MQIGFFNCSKKGMGFAFSFIAVIVRKVCEVPVYNKEDEKQGYEK